VLLWYFA